MDAVVQETDLPFTWRKLALGKQEERPDDVELVQAWVVDVPDQTHVAPLLRWLKQSGLDTDALSHLKRVRRRGPLCTLLLDTSAAPPALPSPPVLGPAYELPVPCRPARTPTSLALKNAHWPTAYRPRRKWEPEPWTRAKVRWARDAVRRLLHAAAAAASASDELPIVAHVPVPYPDDRRQLARPFFGRDTRVSTRHPLRHAALDVIRQIGVHRATRPSSTTTTGEEEEEEEEGTVRGGTSGKGDGDDHTIDDDDDDDGSGGGGGGDGGEGRDRNGNGARYLLTGLSLFITHEPCLMCTMALLHSRVKDVFYLVPMPRTGGCGDVACVPSLEGVNHRFGIAVWTHAHDDGGRPALLDAGIDA